MQIYCEPYFTCILRAYQDMDILKNRLLLFNTVDHIIRNSLRNEKYIEYDIIVDHPNVSLEKEVVPTCGRAYVPGGDEIVFRTTSEIMPSKRLFQLAGLFFQSTLLKSLTGINKDHLIATNSLSWTSVIKLIEKVFRLPNAAGNGYIFYRTSDTPFGTLIGSNNELYGSYSLVPFEGHLEKLYSDMVSLHSGKSENTPVKPKPVPRSQEVKTEVAHEPPKPKASGNKRSPSNATAAVATLASKRTRREKPKVEEEEEEEEELRNEAGDDDDEPIQWTTDHSSVGTKVAWKFFDEYGKGVYFDGEIVKYAPPLEEEPALFHVVWSDGDEQDMDEKEIEAAKRHYKVNFVSK